MSVTLTLFRETCDSIHGNTWSSFKLPCTLLPEMKTLKSDQKNIGVLVNEAYQDSIYINGYIAQVKFNLNQKLLLTATNLPNFTIASKVTSIGFPRQLHEGDLQIVDIAKSVDFRQGWKISALGRGNYRRIVSYYCILD